MGAIRTIFAIIFILYGLTNAINGIFIVLGMNPPLFYSEGVGNTNEIISEIIPLEYYGIVTLLWGSLWMWIGSKVRTGGQRQQ